MKLQLSLCMLLNIYTCTCFLTDMQQNRSRKRKVVSKPKGTVAAVSAGPSVNTGPSNPNPNPGPPSPDQEEQDMDGCPHCFQTICITARPKDWLGQGQAACDDNSALRRVIYNHYWKMIDNLGEWRNPRYLEHKKQVGGGEWVVVHRREIMPLCVLTEVRHMYPNPPSVPYMGHMWE
jgi:hypothetical protein